MTPSPIQTGKLEWTNGWPIYSTSRGLDRTTRFPARMTLLRVAIVPGTSWAVEFLINDGGRQVELKGFVAL